MLFFFFSSCYHISFLLSQSVETLVHASSLCISAAHCHLHPTPLYSTDAAVDQGPSQTSRDLQRVSQLHLLATLSSLLLTSFCLHDTSSFLYSPSWSDFFLISFEFLLPIFTPLTLVFPLLCS